MGDAALPCEVVKSEAEGRQSAEIQFCGRREGGQQLDQHPGGAQNLTGLFSRETQTRSGGQHQVYGSRRLEREKEADSLCGEKPCGVQAETVEAKRGKRESGAEGAQGRHELYDRSRGEREFFPFKKKS